MNQVFQAYTIFFNNQDLSADFNLKRQLIV